MQEHSNKDDFIGKIFGSQGQLEVISISHKRDADYVALYKVHCSICANDTEMFGNGDFAITKMSLRTGSLPCGCSPSPKYTTEQHKILLKRLCKNKNYSIEDYPDKIISTTNFTIKCNLCNDSWKTNASRLFRQGQGCRKCSKSYRYNQKESEDYIESELINSPYKFVGWDSPYKTVRTKMQLECADHGIFLKTVNKFRTGQKTCPGCAKNGFKAYKDAYFYVLLIKSNSDSFTGYGITNQENGNVRLRNHVTNCRKAGYHISEIRLFLMSGTQAQSLERLTKRTFELYSQNIEGFIKEATSSFNYESIIDLAKNFNPDGVMTELPAKFSRYNRAS